MDRIDALLKELHAKDRVITALKSDTKAHKERVDISHRKILDLHKEIEDLKEELRRARMCISIERRRTNNIEKKARAHINRSLSVIKEPQRAIANKVLVLEWIVRELAEQRNLPGNEIVALCDICSENDPMLKNILEGKPKDYGDLIDYLDKNGVKSLLGIDVDQSLLED